MQIPRFARPALLPHRPLLLLLLALFSSCRSERAAFAFQAPLKMPVGAVDSAASNNSVSAPVVSETDVAANRPSQPQPQSVTLHPQAAIIHVSPKLAIGWATAQQALFHRYFSQETRVGQTGHLKPDASHAHKPAYSGPSDEVVILILVLAILVVFVGLPFQFSSLLSIGYGKALLVTFGVLLGAFLLAAVITSIIESLTDRYYKRNTN